MTYTTYSKQDKKNNTIGKKKTQKVLSICSSFNKYSLTLSLITKLIIKNNKLTFKFYLKKIQKFSILKILSSI